MEDSKIIDLFFVRSEQAIEETASKYGSYCYSIAYNILSNSEDCYEAVNDTYLAAWNSIPPNRPSIFRTYLGKIARRVSLKKWRDYNRDKRGGGEVTVALEELEECIPSAVNVEDKVLSGELSILVNDFIRKLPDDERRLFICRYWYLDTIDKISLESGYSKSKVKSMLHRTRGKLFKYLETEGVL